MGHFCICIVGIAMQPPFQMVVLEVLNYVIDVLHFVYCSHSHFNLCSRMVIKWRPSSSYICDAPNWL